jgi:nucleotide-binding universal stress UspA family protein
METRRSATDGLKEMTAMFQRVLLGMDDSAASQLGLSFMSALARQHSAAVRVLYVNQYVVGGRGHTVLTAQQAQALVDGAVAELQDNGVAASGEVVRATCFNLAARIAERADAFSADAIVLGSHRHRRVRRLFSQGVRDKVIQMSALPVLTTPAPLRVSPLHPSLAGSPPQPISRPT